ncbi:hypothetical protein [Halostella sp. PRR32]|uniref:hypothetical protein n=1 Tax=Halostella sp. PRR32 TaxID=3098147 RepID=UPI002B1DA691|nr:hypothetical protein [Halostella sp. PRR32]
MANFTFGGLDYDDVAGALDHAAGSTDEATHRSIEGAAEGDFLESFKHATGDFIIAGDDDGQAETLTEGLFSPGEQYTATGWFRTAVDTVFENPEPFTNQEDSVDLVGPSAGDAFGQITDPLVNDPGEDPGAIQRILQWLLNNPGKTILGVGGIMALALLGPALEAISTAVGAAS